MDSGKHMPTHLRSKRSELLSAAGNWKEWPSPDTSGFSEFDRKEYLRLKRGVQLWIEGARESDIKRETSLTIDFARRTALRCAAISSYTKAAVGFHACVRGYRAKSGEPTGKRNFVNPTTRAGFQGALRKVFFKYSEIEKKLTEFVSSRMESGSAPEAVINIAKIHKRFLALCKDHELHDKKEWPFTCDRRGYEAVRRWYKKWRHGHPALAIRNEMGDEAAKVDGRDRTQSQSPRPRASYLAYERCELDEHHEDARWSIVTPLGGDRFVHVAAQRIWALVMRDCGSRAALSCGISTRIRYGKPEILKLTYQALMPPQRRKLSIQNEHFKYHKDACFPGELPEFSKLTWQALAFDADRAHFSNQMLEVLKDEIRCDVYGERIGTATARYSIEGFFINLARMNDSLPSATGNRPDSAARRAPDVAAERFAIHAPLAHDMIDVKCRNYNVTPNSECGGISPIQKLYEMLARGEVYRSAIGELRQANLYRLLPKHDATLNRKRGPDSLSPLSVTLFGGRYVGPELAKDSDLSYCGDKAVFIYVQEDARFAFVVPRAYPDRCYRVRLTGRYSETPHTLDWRRLVEAYRKNAHTRGDADAPFLMVGVLRTLGEAAKTSNASAAMLSGIMAFQDSYGRGNEALVSMPPDAVDKLRAYAETVAAEDGELESDDDIPAASNLVLPSDLNAAQLAAYSRKNPDSGRVRAHDTFGLL